MLLFFGMIFISLNVFAQEPTYKIVNGQITRTAKTATVRKPDSVYVVKDGITFYKGPKGGIYYWRVSPKTGKKYKAYLKRG